MPTLQPRTTAAPQLLVKIAAMAAGIISRANASRTPAIGTMSFEVALAELEAIVQRLLARGGRVKNLYGPDGERLAAGDAGSVLHRLTTALGDGGHPPVSAAGRPPSAVLDFRQPPVRHVCLLTSPLWRMLVPVPRWGGST